MIMAMQARQKNSAAHMLSASGSKSQGWLRSMTQIRSPSSVAATASANAAATSPPAGRSACAHACVSGLAAADSRRSWTRAGQLGVAVGETVILLHPPLPSFNRGVERGRRHTSAKNDTVSPTANRESPARARRCGCMRWPAARGRVSLARRSGQPAPTPAARCRPRASPSPVSAAGSPPCYDPTGTSPRPAPRRASQDRGRPARRTRGVMTDLAKKVG